MSRRKSRLVILALLAAAAMPFLAFDAVVAEDRKEDVAGGSAEKEAFESAKELGTVEAWDAFLANYPTGFRADLARAYVKKLADKPDPKPGAAATLSAATAEDVSCAGRSKLHSRKSDAPAKITFVNKSGMDRAILWLDFEGNPKTYADLKPGEERTFDTYVTHPWMVADRPGNCLRIYMPGNGVSVVRLESDEADEAPRKKVDRDEEPRKKTEKTKKAETTKCPKGTYRKDGDCVAVKESKRKKTPLEYARENCKETGGYWTGATCKASKTSRPQKCKPGYAWSEDAGACQWDGGPET